MSPQESQNRFWKQHVKANLFLCTTWKHIRGIEVQLHSFVPLALNLCSSAFSASRFRRLVPGKEPRYPLNRGLDGPQGLSRRFWEEENLLLPGIEPLIVQRIASVLKYNNNNNNNNTNFPPPPPLNLQLLRNVFLYICVLLALHDSRWNSEVTCRFTDHAEGFKTHTATLLAT